MMKIGDSLVMVSDAEIRDPMHAFLYVVCRARRRDVSATLEAGAVRWRSLRKRPTEITVAW
jgi:hypothetical protein